MKHVRNGDDYLSKGGVNEVSAANLKTVVDILNATYYIDSLAESDTTSSYPNYRNKVTLNVTPVAGNYILQYDACVANSSGGSDTWIKFHNGTNIYCETRINCAISYANSGLECRSGFIKLTLTATEMNFYLDFCRQSSTAYIKNAKIMLRRTT